MNPNNLSELISTKGIDWESSISNAREVLQDKFLNDKSLIRLAMNSEFPHELNTIIKCLYQDSKERPAGIPGIDFFFKAVNYSSYSLKDWLKVVYFFDQWLSDKNRSSPFLKLIGYLQCCEESPENKDISQTFIHLVEDMLTQHGFIG
jgi:hypothetical protein